MKKYLFLISLIFLFGFCYTDDSAIVHIDCYSSLNEAVLYIGDTKRTLIINDETVIESGTSVVIPDNLSLSIVNGGFISGVPGGNIELLIINGTLDAGNYSILDPDLIISGLKKVNPMWFGANGTPTDAISFQSAHDALGSDGGDYYIPPLLYTINTEIIFSKKVHVYGSGNSTILKASANTMTSVFQFISGANGSIIEFLQFQGGISSLGGVVQRAVYVNGAKNCVIKNLLVTGFNIGVDINGVNSGYSKVYGNRFTRMVSAGGNGTSILIEASEYNRIYENEIDDSEFVSLDSPSAAIFLTAAIGGVGSVYNYIGHNIIRDHPQVGISINSTTYFEFVGNLGACDYNTIQENDIYNCSNSNGGDSSSGIAIHSNSSFNGIIKNKIHHNGHITAGGYGIIITGSKQGDGTPGTPKMDETPIYNKIIGNEIYCNKDTGLRINGAAQTTVKNNIFYENGQRDINTFYNTQVVKVSTQSSGNNTKFINNEFVGSQPMYQLHIGSGVDGTIVKDNIIPSASTGAYLDEGLSSTFSGNI